MNQAKLFYAVLTILLTMISPALAQRGGTGSGMSMGGMSMGGGGLGGGFGGGGMATGMSGVSGFGGGSGMGMGMGMSSGMGSGMGMGGMGGGMGGFGTGMGGSGMGGFGQSGMNNMQGGQQAFIGRDSGDMANVFRQMGRSSNQFLQQLNRTMGRGRGRNNSSQEENAVLPVRVRLDVAFDAPPVQPTVVADNVRTRLATTLARQNMVAPIVELAGDTVVLRGVAQKESQRMVIEQLVLMEPGVFAVDNQMTVAENPSENHPSAPAPRE
jgi:hypothetical protein